MRKTLLVLALIFGMTGLARGQQKQVLSAAATTCTTTGTSCLINTVDPSAGGVTFTVTANASGNTLVFEASGDGGTTWVALNATPSNSTTAATSTTSTGTWQANIAAYTNVRIRMSTLAGGTSTVSIIFSIASARAGGGGGGGGGVTSFSGDGTVITNSASTGAVTTTIAGTSGGIPYFSSSSGWASSGALASTALVVGGGAGTAPTTGSGDYTYSGHTLAGGAAGIFDLHAQTGVNSFILPTISNGVPTTNGACLFNTNNYISCEAANQLAIPLVESATHSAGQIMKTSITGFPIQVISSITDNGTTVTTTEPVNAAGYQTATNCKANGTAANPSVASCTSAAAGMFSCATNASTGTCTVNTTAVTANSEIAITQNAADGGAGQLNVTCNTGNVLSATAPLLAAKVGGTSFTINLGTVSTNPACFEYVIVN